MILFGTPIIYFSLFTSASTVVPAYKKPANCDMPRDQAEFNNRLSNLRVRIDNVIGILKRRSVPKPQGTTHACRKW